MLVLHWRLSRCFVFEGCVSFASLGVLMCGMFVMYGSTVFSSVLAYMERSQMGLNEIPRFFFLLAFGMGMMSASFHMCIMTLVLMNSFICLRRYSNCFAVKYYGVVLCLSSSFIAWPRYDFP